MKEKLEKTTKVFVYGTLKEGRPLDRRKFAELRTSVEEATITGSIFSLGPFPTIKLDGEGTVRGEVHTFKSEDFAAVLRSMDSIEGFSPARDKNDNLYNRYLIEATLASGETVDAFAYEINRLPERAKKLEDGVWEPGM